MALFAGRDSLVKGGQAQQVYRFVLNIKGVDAALIKSVSSPKYKVETAAYDLLEYKFNYPKKLIWQPVSFEILQILDQEALSTTISYYMSKVYNSQYYASPMGIGSGQRDLLLPNALFTTRDTIKNFLDNGPADNGYSRTSSEGTVLDFSKIKLQNALGRVEIKTLDEEGKIYESWRLRNAFVTDFQPSDLTYETTNLATVKLTVSYDWAEYGMRGVYAEEDVVSRVFGV